MTITDTFASFRGGLLAVARADHETNGRRIESAVRAVLPFLVAVYVAGWVTGRLVALASDRLAAAWAYVVLRLGLPGGCVARVEPVPSPLRLLAPVSTPEVAPIEDEPAAATRRRRGRSRGFAA